MDIEQWVPLDWLNQHREEYIGLCEKVTKLIMMAEAANQGWSKPLKTPADFEAFIAVEADRQNQTTDKIRRFLLDAGKIKARNRIFEKYCLPLLPKDEKGECRIPRKIILEFIKYSVEDLPRQKNP